MQGIYGSFYKVRVLFAGVLVIRVLLLGVMFLILQTSICIRIHIYIYIYMFIDLFIHIKSQGFLILGKEFKLTEQPPYVPRDRVP